MKAGRSYPLGLVAVFAGGWLLSFALEPADRYALRLASGVGLAIQGPAGWWLVRSIGTPSFLAAWIVGMGVRVALVALFALVVVPAMQLPMQSMLFALVGVLLALLVVEVVVINLANQRTESS